MKVYRIKHIPTGLYFRPSRKIYVKHECYEWSWPTRSNLSKVGKVYAQKPSPGRYMKDGFWNHTNLRIVEGAWNRKHPEATKESYNPSDWAIEESEI